METGRALTRDDILLGAHFNVKYVGSIAVEASMKSLDFSLRTAIAKECIVRVCESAHLISRTKRRPREASAYLGPGVADLSRGLADVSLIVSRDSINVVPLHKPPTHSLFRHPMPFISFASGGDDVWTFFWDTAEFVCYVAKSEEEGRRAYVFECGLLNAGSLLEAIGLAFKLRYEEAQKVGSGIVGAGIGERDEEEHKRKDPVGTSDGAETGPLEGSEVELRREPWFHGALSRQEAESLLRRDGDFLVRQSAQSPHQFVLTGLQSGTPKHLLLIDTDGRVRTKDREFPSVSNLISYHRENNIPITSAESALILKTPILHNSAF